MRPARRLAQFILPLTLSDRPELRIDPTTLISTGAIANVSGAQVYSVEAAGTYGPLFFQGEYFWFNIDRNAFNRSGALNSRLELCQWEHPLTRCGSPLTIEPILLARANEVVE